MGIGEKLKKAREEKGLTLEDLEEETKIRKLYLEALEEEQFDVLPPKVYAVGFLRRYARTLGLAEEEMIKEFKSLAYSGEENEELDYEKVEKVKISKFDVTQFSVKNILAGIIFLIIAIWIGNYIADYFAGKAQEGNKNISPPPVVERENPVKEKEQIKEQPKPVYTGVNLVIKANQNCWLNVKVDGNEVFRAVLPAGESKSFKGNEEIYIKAGNAGGIDITFNGEKLGSLGKTGQVIEKKFTKGNIEEQE
ncbi:RodZ domain-containing protein [Thermosyntropha sp.]|uniref:helix-turn-helix domain-containing protein n=1 Tax=Thermosyntropha sp. TaxID=2740820 RepID=UPI0025D546A4|nr:RodZ domain-containing protein [Thermosyntropha sp.]MBO8158551.1 helix-turn-helix domain-containing protein [Thermosyntropha sp.]